MPESEPERVLRTARLIVRRAAEEDIPLYMQLWNDPRVMGNVGFPQGLRTTPERVRGLIRQGRDPFDSLLVAALAKTGMPVGECRLHPPDETGIASTDVKLLPRHQSVGYGSELKRGLVGWLFENTDCRAVKGTPGVDNIASIRMQESVGGVRVGKATYRFPGNMSVPTRPVEHYIYLVRRCDWETETKA